MQKVNIVWLASYPKSGNTWFRAFLSALFNETGDIDLNGLKTNGIFSSREIFDAYTDLDSRYLYDTEIKEILPDVYRKLSDEANKMQYIKVHDAYTYNSSGEPIIPKQATHAAVYIIRNPLDIAASLANHLGSTIDHAIRTMNAHNGSLATQKNNLNVNVQLKQLMFSWSMHVESWTNQTDFPALVIRYEDLLQDPFITFSKAMTFLEVQASDKKIFQAIEATSFQKLQQKELLTGFREKNARSKMFFRSGSAGNWINELTKEQATAIIRHHSIVMKRYNYPIHI